jgi:cation:H+ antiporter
MTIFFWIIIFVVSLTALLKSSDLLIDSSEKIGLRIGLSPFIIGVTIVAFGTSLPELVASFVAVSQGVTDVVTGNAIGSNIANILLVVGVAAIVGKNLRVTKNLIDLDLPLLAISTGIFFMTAADGKITLIESVVLLSTYVVYLFYTLKYNEDEESKEEKPVITTMDIIKLFIGIAGLSLGAKFLIDSIVNISDVFNIATGVIAVTAVAIGTSLPELIVSVKAVLKGKAEVALGNVFGSNIFNILVVIGLPGIFSVLVIDPMTFSIGIPVLIMSTVLFVISGISKRIHAQEGWLYIILYIVFISKLFELF